MTTDRHDIPAVLARLGVSGLIGAFLSIIPSAILPDFIAPFDRWYESERAKAGSPKAYTLDHLPPILAAEIKVFKFLTVPPSWVGERFGRSRTEYARLVVSDGIATEAWPFTPPFWFAMEHLKIALPFWTLVTFCLIQASAALRATLARRPARLPAA